MEPAKERPDLFSKSGPVVTDSYLFLKIRVCRGHDEAVVRETLMGRVLDDDVVMVFAEEPEAAGMHARAVGGDKNKAYLFSRK